MLRIIPLLTILALIPTPTLFANSTTDLVTKKCHNKVGVAVVRLENALRDRGATIAARIDHAAAAKKAGLDLPPTQLLIFGNPKLGTMLMQNDRPIGLELPMKVLAWEDNHGQTWLSYKNPKSLAHSYKVDGQVAVLNIMSDVLDSVTTIAAGI